MKTFLTIIIILALLFILSWVGLYVTPKPFDPFPAQAGQIQTMSLPDSLPAPVRRFYQELYGDEIPLIRTAVISGRAEMRIKGIRFPARFRMIHDAGQGYRHYFELTLFGMPLMTVNEFFLEGKIRMELPFALIEDEPKVNQAANLALWAEPLVWLPSLLVTDSRVRWQSIDDNSALLWVPFEGREQAIMVRFDPESGLVRLVEAMRFREADSPHKTLWLNEALRWSVVDGFTVGSEAAVTWFDEGSPWATFTVEEVVYNVDITKRIEAKGP